MKYALVTTFAAKHYDLYGKNMIETFNKHWPQDVEIHIYHEGNIPHPVESSRLFYHDLEASSPDLMAFKARHKDDPVANGMPNNQAVPNGKRRPETIKEKWKLSPSYLWDAIRFSHKVYAQTHLAANTDADVMYWVDADSITFRDVGDAHKSWLPEGKYCAYLGRHTYTECGFIAFNLAHQASKEFMDRYKALYDTDEVFNMGQWTDCHTFDRVRTEMENEGKIVNHNLNPTFQKGHPFINTELGDYMDHLKGRRKDAGHSRPGERQDVRGVDYWKNLRK